MGRSKALKSKTQKKIKLTSSYVFFIFKPIDFIDNDVPNYSDMIS